MPNVSETSPWVNPRTSWSSRQARCRGGSLWRAATNARLMSSSEDLNLRVARRHEHRVGHRLDPGQLRVGRGGAAPNALGGPRLTGSVRAFLDRNASRHALVAMRYNHPPNAPEASKVSSRRHARSKVSWSTSSASVPIPSSGNTAERAIAHKAPPRPRRHLHRLMRPETADPGGRPLSSSSPGPHDRLDTAIPWAKRRLRPGRGGRQTLQSGHLGTSVAGCTTLPPAAAAASRVAPTSSTPTKNVTRGSPPCRGLMPPGMRRDPGLDITVTRHAAVGEGPPEQLAIERSTGVRVGRSDFEVNDGTAHGDSFGLRLA